MLLVIQMILLLSSSSLISAQADEYTSAVNATTVFKTSTSGRVTPNNLSTLLGVSTSTTRATTVFQRSTSPTTTLTNRSTQSVLLTSTTRATTSTSPSRTTTPTNRSTQSVVSTTRPTTSTSPSTTTTLTNHSTQSVASTSKQQSTATSNPTGQTTTRSTILTTFHTSTYYSTSTAPQNLQSKDLSASSQTIGIVVGISTTVVLIIVIIGMTVFCKLRSKNIADKIRSSKKENNYAGNQTISMPSTENVTNYTALGPRYSSHTYQDVKLIHSNETIVTYDYIDYFETSCMSPSSSNAHQRNMLDPVKYDFQRTDNNYSILDPNDTGCDISTVASQSTVVGRSYVILVPNEININRNVEETDITISNNYDLESANAYTVLDPDETGFDRSSAKHTEKETDCESYTILDPNITGYNRTKYPQRNGESADLFKTTTNQGSALESVTFDSEKTESSYSILDSKEIGINISNLASQSKVEEKSYLILDPNEINIMHSVKKTDIARSNTYASGSANAYTVLDPDETGFDRTNAKHAGKNTDSESYTILDPNVTGYNRTKYPQNKDESVDLAKTTSTDGKFGITVKADRESDILRENEYDTINEHRNPEIDDHVYNHSSDNLYDSSTHNRKEPLFENN